MRRALRASSGKSGKGPPQVGTCSSTHSKTSRTARTVREEGSESPISLRPAIESDLKAINNIYNYYVLHSTCTYQEKPEPIKGREHWFQHHGPKHPVTVAVKDNKVVGWGSLSAYHPRSAYRRTVENSVYVHHGHHGRGIGSLLLEDLVARARKAGHRAIIAVIDADQPASIALHSKFRFKKVGHFKQIGFKFGRWLDVVYMELLLV